MSRGDPPPVSDDTTHQGKYHHLLESVWFFNDALLAFQTLFSQSITCSTASLYMPHVGHWLICSRLHNISPIDPFLHDIASYISTRAQSLPTSSVKIALSALQKFLLANLNPATVLDNHSLVAPATGLENIPHNSQPHCYRLAMMKDVLAPNWARPSFASKTG